MKKDSIMEFCLVPPPYGGVTVYVKRLSDQLRQDGYIVGGYYTSECKDLQIQQSPYYYETEYNASSPIILRALFHVIRIVKNVFDIRPFSIVHYHGLENLKLLWFLHKYCKKKVVITVHSAMVEGFYRRTNWVNKRYMRKLAEVDIQWIAVSEQVKQCMLKLPFTFFNEISVIAAYVPVPQDSSTPLSLEMRNYIKSHTQNIAFYARSFMCNDGTDVYGFDAVLQLYVDILKHYNNTVGMVFCLSEDKDKQKIDQLHSKAKDLGIFGNIYWQIGAIDNINLVLQNVDVYVRPTSTDGDSVAVREVLDQGVQVVASDVCWRPKGVIIYHIGDSDDFVKKTMEALKKGKSKASSNFGCYNAMKDVFDKI